MNARLEKAIRYVAVGTMLFAFNGAPTLAGTIDTDTGANTLGLTAGGLDAFGNRIFTFSGNLNLSDVSNTITGTRGMRIQATGNINFNTPFTMSGAAGLNLGNGGAAAPLAEFGGGRGGSGMVGNASPSVPSGVPNGSAPLSGAGPLSGGTNGANAVGSGNPGTPENGDQGGGGGGGSYAGAGGDGGTRNGNNGIGGTVFGAPDIRGAGALSGGGGGGGGGSGWGGASGGNGGGALSLEAGGDLTLGALAAIDVSGGVGGGSTGDNRSAGGGAAGGSIMLSGDNVLIDALASLIADGGAGGLGEHNVGGTDPEFTGGGGGGGRIAVYADAGDITIAGSTALAGDDAPLTFLTGTNGGFGQFSTLGGTIPLTGSSVQPGIGGSLYLEATAGIGAAVPEPSSIFLFSLAGAMAGLYSWRRRKRVE